MKLYHGIQLDIYFKTKTMKLIKITEEHYIVVDNSKIEQEDWFYNPATKEILYASKEMLSWNSNTSQEHKGWKKITYSTIPLDKIITGE